MRKNGQSIIEFVLILILVIVGVVFMGPYVLRSIDSHFKFWDVGVQDSVTDTLNQASNSVVPDINPNCSCTPDTSSGCGCSDVSQCQCSPGHLIWNTNCTPTPGCDGRPTTYCSPQTVDQCCTTYTEGPCGGTAIPSSGIPSSTGTVTGTGNGSGGNGIPSGVTGDEYSIPTCYYGQRIWATGCSDMPVVCVTDPSCAAACSGGSVYPDSATPCYNEPGEPQSSTPNAPIVTLDSPTKTIFVEEPAQGNCPSGTGSACSTSADCPQGEGCQNGTCNCTFCNGPCQEYCNPPYVLDVPSDSCELQFYVAAASCCSTPVPLDQQSPTTPNVTAGAYGTITYTSGSCVSSPRPSRQGTGDCTDLPNGGPYSGAVASTNDQSFTVCTAPGTIITWAGISGATATSKCGDKAGFAPGNECNIQLNF